MLTEGLHFANRYELIHLLGRGGFSEVWLAIDTKTNIQVAVKVYAPGTGLDDAGIQLFTQEFSLVFDMIHSNLLCPTYYDCWDRMPFLILPYCKNGSTLKYTTTEQNLPEKECWKMLHDVAAGLAYLHGKTPSVIHQDIKPDNILINDEGNYMITDFGISARVRSTIHANKAAEQSGGTMAYMGPERFSSRPKPVMASDIWSLGAMMFEIMTKGNPPFGHQLGGVLQKNGAEIPIIEESYSQELKNIIYRCLALETWERPTAKEIEELAYNHLHGITSVLKDVNETATKEKTNEIKDVKGKKEKDNFTKEKKVKGNDHIYKNKWFIMVSAVLLLGIIILLCTPKKADPVVTEQTAKESVDFDSVMQIKIAEALQLKHEADTFLLQHPDDKYDIKYKLVEQIYIDALNILNKEDNKGVGYSSETFNNIQKINKEIVLSLSNIYKEMETTAHSLREAGIPDAAEEFEKRTRTIQPYINLNPQSK